MNHAKHKLSHNKRREEAEQWMLRADFSSHTSRLKAVVRKLPVGAGLVSNSKAGRGSAGGFAPGGESVNAADFKEAQDVFTYL